MADQDQRGRGILTSRDRDFLKGVISYDGQQRRNVRGAIRKRVKNAMLDFKLLYREMDDRDLNLIFEDLKDSQARTQLSIEHKSDLPGESIELDQGLVYAIAFLYRCTETTELSPEKIFTQGLRIAEDDAIVSVEITDPNTLAERGLKKALQGEQLSEEESRAVTTLLQQQAHVGPDTSVNKDQEER